VPAGAGHVERVRLRLAERDGIVCDGPHAKLELARLLIENGILGPPDVALLGERWVRVSSSPEPPPPYVSRRLRLTIGAAGVRNPEPRLSDGST
jgi:hypothetical protein